MLTSYQSNNQFNNSNNNGWQNRGNSLSSNNQSNGNSSGWQNGGGSQNGGGWNKHVDSAESIEF